MKKSVVQFKGRIPKISDRALPETNATMATNCRLRSGDLEAYRGMTSVTTLNKTPSGGDFISTIYPMDRDAQAGGPFWLSWLNSETAPGTQKVDVVRGNLLSDTTERTYFTGAKDATGSLYRPKFTNLALATTTPVKSTGYPYNWRLLGVPAPGTFNNTVTPPQPLTVTQTLNTSALTYSVISDGSDLTNWTTSTQQAAISTVTVDAALGNPLPSFDLFQLSPTAGTNNTATYLYQDIGLLTGPGSFKFDFRFDQTGAATNGYFFVYLGVDKDGKNGTKFFFPLGTWGNQIRYGTADGWGTSSAGAVLLPWGAGPNSPANLGQFYTLQFDYFNVGASLTTFNLNITLLSSGVPILTVNLPNFVTSGNTFFGAQTNNLFATGWTGSNLHIDNVLLEQVKLLDNPEYEATVWTYTYVDDFGQEGPPAPATALYFIGPGITTVLTNFDGTGYTDYNIVSMNLYRAVTGTSSTQFQFEDNLPLTTTTYTDTKVDSQLGEVLQTDNYDLPPDDSLNIVNLPNGITIVSSGNTICPSIQYRPYAYPVEYRLATDFPVIAMIGMETAAIALTEQSAYLIIGSDPSVMSMSKITPEYGCTSKKSAIRWGNYGAVYAANQGLVIVGMSGAQLITDGYITKKEWLPEFFPRTIEGAIYEDMYYGWYNDGTNNLGFIFDQKDDGVGFININTGCTASYSEHLNELIYICRGHTIFTWDTDSVNLLSYIWKSKVWKNNYPVAYGVAQLQGHIDTGFNTPVTFDLFKDEAGVYFTKGVTNTKEFLIPSVVSYDIQFALLGTTTINSAQIAEDMMELS